MSCMTIMFLIMYMIITNNKKIHPIYLLLFILIYTIMISLILSMWSPNFMYSIMLFLIIISGLLIIFLYFSSLVSNEQTTLNMSIIMLMTYLMNLFLLINTISTTSMPPFKYPTYPLPELTSLFSIPHNPFNNISQIYMYPHNNLTNLSLLYLLITLLTIIKICSIKSTSLRKIS